MKTLILFLAILFSLSVEGQVHVKGYTKSNGTYVAPYTRSSPNSSPYDNYSFPGNTNPYTGKTATGNPDTYINNLYNNNSTPSKSDVWVDGYYRSDGTYIIGHYRSAPNGNPYDNFSFPGNTNPYTGKTATGSPDTYLKNYYGNSSSTNGTTYYVSSISLNVRSGPSTNYSVLTSLSYGDDVQVIETSNLYWYKVKVGSTIGYVNSSNLTFTSPLLTKNDYYSTPSTNYSNTNYNNYTNSTSSYNSNSYHPYGYNKGKITLWTDCSDDGQISVYIDDEYKGVISSYFDGNSSPNCGDDGTLVITLAAGTYKIKASGNKKIWEGFVTVSADECLIQGLSK